ncbi:MAG: peptidylprolyl isomerase [Candidatus Omnitrophica bacterium]|nr:peptidylprolyl isomerase [Candidatus Omnitrophota bacterium]MDD5487862.1 peptidylprolyl isomerase [Candidatus Omnitrophota bacterium]
MKRAKAKHILVDSKEKCAEIIARIEAGEDFSDIACECSLCPSGKQGGDLGEFSQGDMVPEFDKVVFSGELNKVHGPVKTAFGYHLIMITMRNDQ